MHVYGRSKRAPLRTATAKTETGRSERRPYELNVNIDGENPGPHRAGGEPQPLLVSGGLGLGFVY